jgi:hypothetical protein
MHLYHRLGYVDTRLRFTDTYTGTDADGASRLMVEPGLYMTHNLTADAAP